MINKLLKYFILLVPISKYRKYLRSHLNKKSKHYSTIGINISPTGNSFLNRNRIERMDANRFDIFNHTRCNFHLDRYNFAARYTKSMEVIDCASGTGYGAYILKQLGLAKTVTGVEYDKEAVTYARNTYKSKNLNFKQGNIKELAYKDASFDIFVSFETIEHIENEERQLSEIFRVLKPGGKYILSTPNDWDDNQLNPHHVRNYDYFSLQDALKRFFTIVDIYGQNSGTPNRKENCNMPRGIWQCNEKNHQKAECFIIVAEKTLDEIL